LASGSGRRAGGAAVGRPCADRRRAHGVRLHAWPARPRHDLGARPGPRYPGRRAEPRGGRRRALPLPGRSVGARRLRLRARLSLERRVPRPPAALAGAALSGPHRRLRARDAPARRGCLGERPRRRRRGVRAREALSGRPLAMKNAARDWYKDAVFYEVHVKAFRDGNGDGIGDFAGLTESLDYIQELGVDCLWILPMYPSPLRDDGYDIADFYGIHPAYGTVEDFQKFLDAAHARDLRVITDLVMNHTSDQHPWFQASRSSATSPYADYYVWSPSDRRFADARIIFVDTEKSNWTLDPTRRTPPPPPAPIPHPALTHDPAAAGPPSPYSTPFAPAGGPSPSRRAAVPSAANPPPTPTHTPPDPHATPKARNTARRPPIIS